MKKLSYQTLFLIAILIPGFNQNVFSQPELQAWGNMSGIRIDGQLMKFETSIHVVKNDWEQIIFTGKEKQRRPIYKRDGDQQIVTTRIDSLFITNTVKDSLIGTAAVHVKIESKADSSLTGIFFCIKVLAEDYVDGHIQLIEPSEMLLAETISTSTHEILRMRSKGIKLLSQNRQLEVHFSESTHIIVRNHNNKIEVYLEMASGFVKSGQIIEKSYGIKSSGTINRSTVKMMLDTSRPGRPFDGIGGNFRIQNPETDPQVIDYCLENLRVAWARVEMPWFLWHPSDSINPIETANNGNLHPRVQKAMEMAQRLDKMGIPVMLAAWFPPRWAALGEFSFRRQPGGLRGNALNPERMEEIYASITDYILYMKKNYGVEMAYFSFNESDLGINVRQTDKEHTQLIRGLGAYFKSKGLKTTLLLGDTADANGYPFIDDAMADAEAKNFMGAVSFHSWRGWEKETLTKWAAVSTKMNIPLIVGEGSIDAAAWRYPGIFKEQTYALEEINLYVRIMAICQPLTILQWQLTADYSLLAGGGVFGNNDEPLHPTQRFWNLKQLGSTKKGLKFMPLTFKGEDISCAALG
ncbi:MAG: hypothetical protein KAI29_14290, partial [Cyclobacteriaceae bacterium]|nr:hypothetical protein [Cyclobacteriaceae bacterium]